MEPTTETASSNDAQAPEVFTSIERVLEDCQKLASLVADLRSILHHNVKVGLIQVPE